MSEKEALASILRMQIETVIGVAVPVGLMAEKLQDKDLEKAGEQLMQTVMTMTLVLQKWEDET